MKVGDLVQWNFAGTQKDPGAHVGIIVSGPREGTNGDYRATSYAVAWFSEEYETLWHNDYNLELISESRRLGKNDSLSCKFS